MANLSVKRIAAVGSVIALSTAAFVAVPAQAVDDLSLALNSGTSFNSVTGYANELTLNTSIASAYSTADDRLAYRITNDNEAHVQVRLGYTTANVASGPAIDGTIADAVEYDDTVVLADSDASNKTFNKKDVVVDVKATYVGDFSKSNLIGIGVKDATDKNFTVKVQAWLDNNNNQKIDSTEVTSNVVTLTFYDENNVTAVSTVTAPVLGASTVEVVTSTTPELNGQQLGDNFINTKVTSQGNANAVFTSATLSSAGVAGVTTYSGTTKQWTSTTQLAFAAPATPWSGSAVSVSQVDLDASTAATYTSTTSVATLVKAGLGATAGQLVKIAGLGGGSAAELNGFFVVTSYTSNNLVFPGTFTAVGSAATPTGTSQTFDIVGIPANQKTVAAGTYSAEAYIGTTTKLANATAAGVATASAADIKGSITGAANYTGGTNETGGATAISVRKDYTGVIPVTATVYKSTGAVAPNVRVQVTASSVTGTVKVNDTTMTNGKVVSLTADANGAVAFNVSSSTAAANDAITITISSEGLTGNDDSQFTLTWSSATYALYDLKDTNSTTTNILTSRTIDKGGSYTFNLALVDQWGQYLTSNLYRYEVVAGGNTSGTSTHVLQADGVTEVTITDQQLVGGGGTITVDIDVEKFASGAWGADDLTATGSEYEEWASGSGRHTINVITAQTEEVALNASGNALGGSNADLDGNIVTTALVAVDNRLSIDDFSTAATTNVSGIVRNATTLAAVAGTEVTISGPADYFFKVGEKLGKGSLTFISRANGTFDVAVFSNKVMADQVVTVSSNGSSQEIKVKFTGGVTAQSGTQISISAPDSVLPGSTLRFTATVLDKFGNAVDSDQDVTAAAGATSVDATDATYKIAYSGPGLIVGTAPADVKESSVDGNTFNILLGSNDRGSITITVSYDQNGDKDFTDVKDIVQVKTIVIGASAASAGAKVNVGSFNGKLVVYANGHNGKKISWKVGGKWGSAVAASDTARFARVTPRKGVTVSVQIYVDGVLTLTKSVVTK